MPSAERLSAGVALLFLVAALHGLGAADIVGDDEAREAGLVQEIVAGDWLLPRFNGKTFPDKPLLYHWLAAVPCTLTGFSETAVRLPSALAGATTVAWTGWFGARLFGTGAGLASAVALATMPAFFDRTRTARPDVLLVLLLSVALGRAFRWWETRTARDATAALTWLGAATLAKGPVAPGLFILVLVGFLAWEGGLGRLRGLVTVPGAIIFATLAVGWYAVALAGWGSEFVREHLVGRYAGNLLGGFGTAGYVPHGRSLLSHLLFHPLGLLVIALPWTPVAIVGALATRGPDARARFLVCWTLAPVVAFMPTAPTLRYYLLPSLPAAALLSGPVLARIWAGRVAGRAALVTATVGVALWYAVGVAARERRVSAADSLRPFARAVVARLPPPAPVAFFGPPVAPLVVYLGRHVGTLGWRPERITPDVAVIAREPAYRDLAAAGRVGPPLAAGEGRTGNREHGRLILAAGR